MKDDLPTGEHDEAKQAIKCGDCGGTDFTPYNPKTGLMTCADCGQFKQTNASLATAPVVGRQRAEAIVGTLFDDTAACAETLKEAVIDRFASATFNPAPVVTAMLEWLRRVVSGYERESNRDPNSDIRSVRETTAKGILAKLEQIASALPTQPQPSDLEQAAVIWADAILEQRADMCPADRALVNAVGSFVLHTRTDDVALPTALTEAESELTRHKRLCNHCVSDYDLCVVGEEIHLRTMESAAALAAPLPTVSTDVRDRIKHVVEDVVTRFASVFSEYYAATPIMTATLVNEITAALVAAFAGEGEKSQVPTGGMSVLLGYEAGFKEGMEAAKIAKDETERLAEVADGTLDHRHEGAQIVHDAIKEAVK